MYKVSAVVLWVFATLCTSFSVISENGYSLTESMRLARFSSLAYCPKTCLESWQCDSGKNLPPLTNVSFFNNGINLASVYIGYRPDVNQILLSFRGSASYESWVSEWNHRGSDYKKCEHCQIVEDFLKDYHKLEQDVDNKVLALYAKHPKASIIATGHSLGGGLAMIAGMKLKEKLKNIRISAHTFGATRVGN